MIVHTHIRKRRGEKLHNEEGMVSCMCIPHHFRSPVSILSFALHYSLVLLSSFYTLSSFFPALSLLQLQSLVHYSTFSLTGQSGELLWSHKRGDFEAELAYSPEQSSFKHIKLFLHPGQTHIGEVSWHQYGSAVQNVLVCYCCLSVSLYYFGSCLRMSVTSFVCLLAFVCLLCRL